MKKYSLSFILVFIFLLNLSIAIANENTTQSPYISVVSPIGGENWIKGQTYGIRWLAGNMVVNTIINIVLLDEHGKISGIATDIPYEKGSYNWHIPNTTAEGKYKINLICNVFNPPIGYLGCSSQSDAPFNIQPPYVIIPNPIECLIPNCEGAEDTGRKDSNGCIIYNCPATKTCTACVGGVPTGTKDKDDCPIYTCPAITCPIGCRCDEKGNVLECASTSKPCPVNCNCDGQGNIISCSTSPQCPANCNCDDKGNFIKCSIKISCPSTCKCDSNGNILYCEKSECIDSDGGKNYYVKGKVFVPFSNSTYWDTCAYEQNPNESDHNLLYKAYCFVDKYGYGYDYYSCPNGCKDGACIPFYDKKEELKTKTEYAYSSIDCPAKKCKEISKKCLGNDKIVIEECTFYIKSNDRCEEITNTNSKILKGECDNKEVNQVVTFCQGCQLDVSTCIPFGTRLEKKNSAYYCDITKNMIEQKEIKITCQNSYECLSNNCKSGSCTPICEGCLNENKACIPIGTRTSIQFCDSDYSFKNQNSEEGSCNNNYECSSNLCVNNKCISPSLLQRVIDWFKKLFG